MKITWVVYPLDLFEGKGKTGQCNLVCVDEMPLDDGVNGSYVDVLLKGVVSVVLVLCGVGPVLRSGNGNLGQKYCEFFVKDQ